MLLSLLVTKLPPENVECSQYCLSHGLARGHKQQVSNRLCVCEALMKALLLPKAHSQNCCCCCCCVLKKNCLFERIKIFILFQRINLKLKQDCTICYWVGCRKITLAQNYILIFALLWFYTFFFFFLREGQKVRGSDHYDSFSWGASNENSQNHFSQL